MQREKLSSRLGFILLSAGCAIGVGNVYRFPIITGAYGGAVFVLLYLMFLVLLGLPVMTCELAVGRAGQRSIATSFDVLERPGQKWHLMKYLGIGGNYLLMMCYTIVTGLMMTYFVKYLTGSVTDIKTSEELGAVFNETTQNPLTVVFGAVVAVVIGMLVCSLGLQKGVERVSKGMMVVLLVLLVGLGVYSCTLPGAAKGLAFYLVPSFENIEKAGISNVLIAALSQAVFTLSLGMGCIAIFGSYISKERRLTGEAVTIITLDTAVALVAGLIIFPAYFTYNDTMIEGEGGAYFVFTTLSSIFNNMRGGRIVGALFFLLLSFAAMSTVIAVFENIISFWLELTKLKRWQIALINIGLLCVLLLPAAFSFNLLSDVKIFGLDISSLEETLVSYYILPIGSLVYVLFCTQRFGWGWKNYRKEVNCGKGLAMPDWMRVYMTYVLPVIIVATMIIGLL